LPPPSDEEVAAILRRIVAKVTRLAEDLGLRDRPLSDEAHALAATIALPLPRPDADEPPSSPRRSAFLRGFSLHANVFCHENDREALGRLVRYALRPPFALERMRRRPSGDIEYKMKRPLPDGTKTLVLPPAAFLRRIASLVPPPRKHLVKYFGLFAPYARDRSGITPRHTPKPAATPAPTPKPHEEPAPAKARPTRLPWAELLQRVFAIDVFRCDACGGHRRSSPPSPSPPRSRASSDTSASRPALRPSPPPTPDPTTRSAYRKHPSIPAWTYPAASTDPPPPIPLPTRSALSLCPRPYSHQRQQVVFATETPLPVDMNGSCRPISALVTHAAALGNGGNFSYPSIIAYSYNESGGFLSTPGEDERRSDLGPIEPVEKQIH
jgi:hypothetical protein